MYILDYIPTGHDNAVTRETLQSLTHLSDRKIRVLIAEANKSAPDDVLIINLQDGMGYFRPAPDEDYLVRVWKMQEKARGISVDESVDAADRYLGRRKQKKKKTVDELTANQISLFDLL